MGVGSRVLTGLKMLRSVEVETPFGEPSDVLVGGIFKGRKVWFLSRHGQNHTILPTEVNHRANFWALRSLGVALGDLCNCGWEFEGGVFASLSGSSGSIL